MTGQPDISIDLSVVVAHLREQSAAEIGRLLTDLAIVRAERQTVYSVLMKIGELARALEGTFDAEREKAVDALLAYLTESGITAGAS